MYLLNKQFNGASLAIDRTEIKFTEAVGEFSGYGSVFDHADSYGDVIKPGAFDDVIKSGNAVRVYVNHGWLNNELPVGEWSALAQDHAGLFGTARLETRMPKALDAYWAVKGGLVNGLSIGFRVDKEGVETRKDGGRDIYRIKELKEISIVDDPANEKARITQIKQAEGDIKTLIDDLETITDFERFLRDSAAFTRAEALHLVTRAKSIFAAGDQLPSFDTASLVNKLQSLNQKLG